MRLKKRQSHSCMSASALKQSQSHSYCILKNDIPIHEWDCLARWGVPISGLVDKRLTEAWYFYHFLRFKQNLPNKLKSHSGFALVLCPFHIVKLYMQIQYN